MKHLPRWQPRQLEKWPITLTMLLNGPSAWVTAQKSRTDVCKTAYITCGRTSMSTFTTTTDSGVSPSAVWQCCRQRCTKRSTHGSHSALSKQPYRCPICQAHGLVTGPATTLNNEDIC